MKTSTSSIKTFILICHLLLPSLQASCPSKCVKDDTKQGCQCNKICCGEMFWYSRQGSRACDCCTARCSESDNQIEVVSCTLDHNRVCHCKPGFFCTHGNNYDMYCHTRCVPCAAGTFSSVSSLNSYCTPYTDCAKLGKLVLEEGTATHDRVCGGPMTTPLPTAATPTTSKIITSPLSTTTAGSETISPTIHTFINFLKLLHPNTDATQTHWLYLQSSAGTTSATSANPGGKQLLKDPDSMSKVFLLLIILLMILMLGVIVFCMLRKSTVLKILSKQTGFMSGKHSLQKDPDWRQAVHAISSNSQTFTQHSQSVADLPLCSDVSEVRGQSTGVTSHSGGAQQVNMEHNVKGENVSNTIGSIYIYSPGMVVLGSNSGDKKDEAGDCDEDVPLISTPQQESTPPSQEVSIKMNAPEEPSLSFPVPATGN